MFTVPGAVTIMVIDDHPSNVLLLQQMLERKGYGVRTFLRGRDAVEAARQKPPDLILLDINMPGLDGYQVCKLLKQDPGLVDIPVIFLSAISQTRGKMEAFRCGGVDYISKPFEFEEVQARVETHLKLSALQNRLRDHNIQLEAVVGARTARTGGGACAVVAARSGQERLPAYDLARAAYAVERTSGRGGLDSERTAGDPRFRGVGGNAGGIARANSLAGRRRRAAHAGGD
ncbi:MAG: response regulator [Ignavibacteriota bacterium]